MRNISDHTDLIVHTASTPEQEEAARRYVCAKAKDAEEARELLAMLGLAP